MRRLPYCGRWYMKMGGLFLHQCAEPIGVRLGDADVYLSQKRRNLDLTARGYRQVAGRLKSRYVDV